MTEQEIFVKNLILSTEFDRYVMENPEFAEKIPLNAQIVILPEDDRELCKIPAGSLYSCRFGAHSNFKIDKR